jgi:protein CpxP
MTVFQRIFKSFFNPLLVVIGAAIALPFTAQGEPTSDSLRERCAGPMISLPDHDHEDMMGGGMFPVEAPPMNGRPPLDGQFGPGIVQLAPIPPFLRDVKLTEAQQDKVFSILYASIPPLREQGKLARKSADAIHEVVDSSTYDEARLKSLVGSNVHAIAELMILQARTTHQILALLTPEQRKQIDTIRAKFDRHALRTQIEEINAKFDAPAAAGDK